MPAAPPRRRSRTVRGSRRARGSGAGGWLPERLVHGLLLLRRELQRSLAVAQLLDVQTRLVAVHDRAEHDARLARVEQRHRARLVAGQLVVGVVADERAVGDAAVDAALDLAHPPLEVLDRL